jgi:hypothetical protein
MRSYATACNIQVRWQNTLGRFFSSNMNNGTHILITLGIVMSAFASIRIAAKSLLCAGMTDRCHSRAEIQHGTISTL